ncbi:hypothetical protein P7L53_15950 [Thermoleptolyngbya sichuanensis XZ-Cy5]|nr:hypothetical protein [Thermoleptolyngbya sichuanensis XZ-Cy5]
MKLRMCLAHPSKKGPIFIAKDNDGWFHVVYRGESLGAYPSAAMAIDDAAGGHTFTPSDGTDLGSLGLSNDIGHWLPPGDFV